MRRLMVMAAMLATGQLAAQVPPATGTNAMAATAATTAADALLAALNGTPADRAQFVATRFAAAALAREDAASRTRSLDALAAAAGGFTLVARTAPGPRQAELIVRSRQGNRFGKLVLFTSRAEPDKIVTLFVLPERDPAIARRAAWPDAPVPLAQVAPEIERRAAALTGENLFSGVVLVAHGDRVLVRRAYGLANQVWHAPNRADTLFHTASIGKMFTAVALLRLVEQGRVSLDDTVAKWVPEYPHPEAATKITLRDLLTHRGGIGEWDGRRVDAPTQAALAATMTAPPGEPGKAFSYSNAGYVLLGAVIEKATGQPFDRAIHDLVFVPAAMRTAAYLPVTAIVANRATGYLRPESDPLGFGPRESNEQYLGRRGDGSGGAYATADDLLAFHRALLAGRLLSPAMRDQALTPLTDFAGAPTPQRYGLGFRLADCAGMPTFGHSGGGANSGVSDATYATRDGRWTVIVLSNYDPEGETLAADICRFVARERG